jgi:hypothetical protein
MITLLKTLFGIAWGTAVLGANFYELGTGREVLVSHNSGGLLLLPDISS